MIGNNLKALRKKLGKSQEEVAIEVGTNRSTYSGYENGVAQPSIDSLIKISSFFKVTIDELLQNDFASYSESDWNGFEGSWKQKAKGSKLRVLTTLVDKNNQELIELVPERARAGYTLGFEDSTYIEELPRVQLPFLSSDRKHRAFQISGDSMLPVQEGAIIVGEFVQNWMQIKSDTPCIVVTKNEGIVFKIIFNHIETDQSLLMISNNPLYQPYSVFVDEVLEVWKMKAIVSTDFPSSIDLGNIQDGIRSLQNDMKLLMKKIN